MNQQAQSGDLEYHVTRPVQYPLEDEAGEETSLEDGSLEDREEETAVFTEADVAIVAAVTHALRTGKAEIDVVCWTREAALAYGGSDFVEQYDEDPEASVSDRIVIRVEPRAMDIKCVSEAQIVKTFHAAMSGDDQVVLNGCRVRVESVGRVA